MAKTEEAAEPPVQISHLVTVKLSRAQVYAIMRDWVASSACPKPESADEVEVEFETISESGEIYGATLTYAPKA